MLTINKVEIKKNVIKIALKATADETLTFAGRVVKNDFGTVGLVVRSEVKLTVGNNSIDLLIDNYSELLPGDLSIRLDIVFPTSNAFLVDEGPFNFRKEENGS